MAWVMATVQSSIEADAPGGAEHRRAPRLPVRMPARVTTNAAWAAVCRVVDLSALGVRIETTTPLSPGRAVLITLPGEPPIEAAVAWADGSQTGCYFAQPLGAESLASLTARFAEPNPPSAHLVVLD